MPVTTPADGASSVVDARGRPAARARGTGCPGRAAGRCARARGACRARGASAGPSRSRRACATRRSASRAAASARWCSRFFRNASEAGSTRVGRTSIGPRRRGEEEGAAPRARILAGGGLGPRRVVARAPCPSCASVSDTSALARAGGALCFSRIAGPLTDHPMRWRPALTAPVVEIPCVDSSVWRSSA